LSFIASSVREPDRPLPRRSGGEAARDRGRFVDVVTDLHQRVFDLRREPGVAGGALAAGGGDDVLGGLELARPLLRVFAVAQQREREHVGPGLVEQRPHELGQAQIAHRTFDHLAGTALGEFEFFLAARGFDVPTLGDLGLARQLLQAGLQLAVGGVEGGRVFLEVFDDVFDRVAQRMHQVRIDVLVAQPVGAGFGDRVEQLARRMLLAHEERAVLQRGAQQRHLQAAEQAHRGRVAPHFAFDLAEQHAQQFEGVVVLARQLRALAVHLPGLARAASA
jgi:hypothetical protein